MTKCNCFYCKRRITERSSQDKLLTARQQQEMFGGVSHMWFRRREADPEAHFPENVHLGRRSFRWHSDLVAWTQSPHAKRTTEFEMGEAAD